MVQELDYNTISYVMESWEVLRRIPNYENQAGMILFQKLFQICPPARVLFGFPIDIDTESPELLESRRFLMHASYMVQMLDTAINMLGPDVDLLTDIMIELGVKHTRYGVKPEMFPHMGVALDHTMKTLLGNRYSPKVEAAWEQTFKVLSQDMIRGQVKK